MAYLSFAHHPYQALFFPVFIHQILLHLGLEQFPTFELVHIIAPIDATFLRQRAAQMRASFKRPRVESFGVAPDDSDIQCMLETVITVQAAHG